MNIKFKNMPILPRIKKKEKQNKWEIMKGKSLRLMKLFEKDLI